MTRSLKRFSTLYSLIKMWDKEEAEYYYNHVDNGYGGVFANLIDEALLLEMECSLQNLTQDVLKCELG